MKAVPRCPSRALPAPPGHHLWPGRDAYHNRGVAIAGLQNPSAAIADFDHALAMRPNFSNTLLNRAKAYIALGNTSAAIRDFEEVLRQKPDNEEARSNLALLRAGQSIAGGPLVSNTLCGSVGCN